MFHVRSVTGQTADREFIEDALATARRFGYGATVVNDAGTLMATIESAMRQWRAPRILGAGNAGVVPLNWGTAGGVR